MMKLLWCLSQMRTCDLPTVLLVGCLVEGADSKSCYGLCCAGVGLGAVAKTMKRVVEYERFQRLFGG